MASLPERLGMESGVTYHTTESARPVPPDVREWLVQEYGGATWLERDGEVVEPGWTGLLRRWKARRHVRRLGERG